MAEKNKDLLAHINGLTTEEQFYFAQRCGSSAAHIRNVAHGFSPCSEKLAINIDRESNGKVALEQLRPDVDWQYVKQKGRRSSKKKH